MGDFSQPQLARFAPLMPVEVGYELAIALKSATASCGIDTPRRRRAFMALAAYNTDGFRAAWSGAAWRFEEALDLPAEKICQRWPQHFPDAAQAAPYAHSAVALAERLYAGRPGNQDADDAYRFRRRGLVGLVGRVNYTRASDWLGYDLIMSPVRAAEPAVAVWIAAHFWLHAGLAEHVDAGRIDVLAAIVSSQLALDGDQ